MYNNCRSRERIEGWAGRRRNYKCRKCSNKFQHDGNKLPAGARICPECLKDPINYAEYQLAFERERATA
ncbi:MAG: hypothetical protein WC329_01820 [Candidatus Omnitrophota bacterium]|jgi:late competence protein required for DNA uptake (superfamily II DNA/RNA helicase)|nr:hypothetical protein [Dehalococcoidales bacterium]